MPQAETKVTIFLHNRRGFDVKNQHTSHFHPSHTKRATPTDWGCPLFSMYLSFPKD